MNLNRKIHFGVVLLMSLFIFINFESVAKDKTKYLIVRADDMGSSHAANLACIEAAKNGIATSIELMVPCSWFNEAVTLLNENPTIDVGIHLTLTSEWVNYKWKPITSCNSITDEQGNFYPWVWPVKKYPGQSIKEASGDIDEIEKELRAQIELALKKIPQISHMTDHMGCLGLSDELKQLGEKLSVEYGLPLYFDDYELQRAPRWSGNKLLGQREEKLCEMLEELLPGTWLTVEHPAYGYPEMQTIDGKGIVAKNRQEVVDVFTSKKVENKAKNNNVKLISYKELISMFSDK